MSEATVAATGQATTSQRGGWLRFRPISAEAMMGRRPLLEPTTRARLIWLFLGLGVVARSVRFLLRFPLWEDESFILANVLERDYVQLLEPLSYHQVSPILWLWAQRAAVDLLGPSELTFRLLPFVCGIASLFLFYHVARRLLRGTAVLASVAVFAVAYPGIRYACEAKPYGTDMFVALAMFALVVEWWRRPEQTRWLWMLAALIPFAVGFSYPAVFVAGGLSVFIGALLLTQKESRGWPAWCVANVLLVSSFCGYFYLVAQSQGEAEEHALGQCWSYTFPPITEPLALAKWVVTTHAGDFLAFPVGGGRGASTVTLICCLVAVGLLIHRRRMAALLLLLSPLVLNFIAAALERYPYGGHVKFSHYLAAQICLVMGVGIAVLLHWGLMARRSRAALRATGVTFLLLALVGVGSMARDFARPYKSLTDLRSRAFAQWFWFQTEFEGETVCIHADLKQDFSPQAYQDNCWSAMALCNMYMYSPRHRAGEQPDMDQVKSDWPLRVVQYREPDFKYDERALEAWLARMQQDYELVAFDSYPGACYAKNERDLKNVYYLDVFKFVPRTPESSDIVRTVHLPGEDVPDVYLGAISAGTNETNRQWHEIHGRKVKMR